MRIPRLVLPVLIACVFPFRAEAVILYGGGNSTNISDPGTGLPWANVVEIENGSGSTVGSGVYLNNQYVLTANHVGPTSQIVIGGSVFFVDTSFNATFAGGSYTNGVYQVGNTDMKILRLTLDPAANGVSGLQPFSLNANATRDVNAGTTNYVLGYGYGKGTAITGGWNWDSGSGGVERWGTNNIAGTVGSVTPSGFTSVTNTLVTIFDNTSGTNEAALTRNDSGGGLFFKFGSTWYLSGISLYTSAANASYYSGDPGTGTGSYNYFARISDYQALITTATAASVVPETPSSALVAFGAGVLAAIRRRKIAACFGAGPIAG